MPLIESFPAGFHVAHSRNSDPPDQLRRPWAIVNQGSPSRIPNLAGYGSHFLRANGTLPRFGRREVLGDQGSGLPICADRNVGRSARTTLSTSTSRTSAASPTADGGERIGAEQPRAPQHRKARNPLLTGICSVSDESTEAITARPRKLSSAQLP